MPLTLGMLGGLPRGPFGATFLGYNAVAGLTNQFNVSVPSSYRKQKILVGVVQFGDLLTGLTVNGVVATPLTPAPNPALGPTQYYMVEQEKNGVTTIIATFSANNETTLFVYAVNGAQDTPVAYQSAANNSNNTSVVVPVAIDDMLLGLGQKSQSGGGTNEWSGGVGVPVTDQTARQGTIGSTASCRCGHGPIIAAAGNLTVTLTGNDSSKAISQQVVKFSKVVN